MKQTILAVAILLGTSIIGVFAQSPAAKATLKKAYPAATGVKWDKEDGDYEASFKNGGKSMSLVIDAKGMVKETETDITVAELPAAVRAYVAKNMPGKKISEAAIIVDASGKKMYEAEVAGKDILFDEAGVLVKK
ncbi:PepSY-like domain-containing protein [Fibrella sp. HMF5335]|uniref:PepSY-like domain-containing protein n=1 Tax=Fibrella rubiginis TaxID=2817060 RepID=A0A939K2V4_9BACT|nr:PepSY-like domain-containing protein [Fibrella rubiginis]MBO0938587.1 PepSY-like domain-containing protein [Fibrella rubiginis]